MNKFVNISIQSLPKLFRIGLFAALILFVSLFFPSNVHFEYEFEYGERWRYNDLKAPFDFPILKLEEELQLDQKRFAQNFTPYYRLDTRVAANQKKLFQNRFHSAFVDSLGNSKTKLDTTEYFNLGLRFLDFIYTKKLIAIDITHQERGQDFLCELLEGDIDVGEHIYKDFMQLHDAQGFMVDTLSKLSKKMPQAKLLLPLLSELVTVPNVTYDSIFTNKTRMEGSASVSPYLGMVKTGELIIVNQGIVDSTIYSKLASLRAKHTTEVQQHKNSFLVYLGYLILTVALIAIFAVFMQFYTPEVLQNSRHLALVVMLIASYAYLSFMVDKVHFLNQYFIPFCIVPIIIQNFFSANLALFTHIVVVLIASMLLSLDYQFILVQLIVGMVAIITKLKTRYLTDFFSSILYIGVAYSAGFISLELVRTGAIFPIVDTAGVVIEQGVRWQMLGWIGLNVFLTLLSFPLIPMLERIFGLTSEITLVELSDLNKPLLRELSTKASGTLQHSLQVANLAEAAAQAIGANALLVKVGALYHDVGKTVNPEYFIENQHQGNPHEQLSYLDSADMVISHVTDGLKLARKYRLPTVLSDFILTHHGTTRVEYFYRMYMNSNPENPVPESHFRYPGPRPRTREEAILMMADSLEAASRSLKSPTGIDIDNLVENIIKGKIANEQFNDTNLTFKELDTVKELFKRLLKSIYHVRIEYPDEKKK